MNTNDQIAGRPWPGFTRNQGSRNTASGSPSVGAQSVKNRRVRHRNQRLQMPLNQERLTHLFEEQKRISSVLRRQSRLLKVGVDEVVSVQAEQLRQINREISAGLSPSDGHKMFGKRKQTDAQVKLKQMLGTQGVNSIGGEPTVLSHPGSNKPSSRRPVNIAPNVVKPHMASHDEFLTLRGPLYREFLRAKDRGYSGPPSRWLKGRTALLLIEKLRHKGLLNPKWTGKLSIFDRNSPLRWSTSGCLAMKSTVRQGLNGEQLCNGNMNIIESVRQARAVQRLPKNEWPKYLDGSLAWPTFPTFLESWERAMRGSYSPSASISGFRFKEKEDRYPRSRIPPGAKASLMSNVIGFRADVVVPRKFLAYFKYRWGFLILRRNHYLPSELIDFISKLWKVDYTKMFFVQPLRYSEALRRIPNRRFYLLSGWVAGSSEAKVVPRDKPRQPYRRLRRRLLRQNSFQPKTGYDTDSISNSSGGLRLY